MYKGTFYDKESRQKFPASVRFTDFGLEVAAPDYILKIQSQEVYAIDLKDKDTVVVKTGYDFPFSVLEVSDLQFKETLLRKHPHVKIHKNHENKGYLVLLGSVLLGIVLCIAGLMYALPTLGEYVATLIPKEAEVQIGHNYYNSYRSGFKIDTAKTRIANQLFTAVDYGKAYPLQITVVHDDIKNAFALPGGHIVIYDRILKDMRSAEEFAALVAHESSHINHRHATKTLGRTAGRTMIISWVFGDYTSLASISQEFLSVSYSRDLEEDADRTGLDLMVKNKIAPQGMIDLLEHLKNGEELLPAAMRYTSTHPLTQDRIDMVSRLTKGKNYDFPPNEALEKVWMALKY